MEKQESSKLEKLIDLISGVSSLIKDAEQVKSFDVITVELPEVVSHDKDSGWVLVGEASMCSGNGSYKYGALIRTDRGTFRQGSNNRIDLKLWLNNFDLKSKEVNKALEHLELANFYLKKEAGQTKA